jgi:hypothetical protein
MLKFEWSDPVPFGIYATSLALLEIFYTWFALPLSCSNNLLQRSRC